MLKKTTRLALAFFSSTLASVAMAASPSVTVGVQVPLSGQYANEGQGIENAVKLIASKLNEKGGLVGHKVNVVACDDGGDAAKAKACAEKLVSEGVFAVVGSYTSGATAASQPIYAKAHVLQTSDGTAEELVLHGYRLFFRNAPPNSAEARFTGHYLVDAKHYKRVAVLSDHSSFSKGLGDSVVSEVEKDGGNVVYRGYIKAGEKNFRSVLAAARAKNPDVIYFSGYYSDGGRIRAQEASVGLSADFVGGDANQNVQFAHLAGAAAVGSVIINFPAPENLPYPQAKEFLAAYKQAYGTMPPSIYTLTNADGMRLIVYAALSTRSLDPERLASYIHTRFHYLPYAHRLQFFPGITGPMGFNMFGERSGSPFQAFKVEPDGQYLAVYP
ncbi:branched-chain amino acid ABC transporter substrate-binding protein [Mangrovitalea sediminis]|uniref:branched-chain amino acid ABC transporter substrate-binding protein n=1 Tax=Mangrovitalea sediminis TaxID=1982043 RepID=UPI000BE5D389|nr:branched-chain amino acid ABC transporter substrate-binding protein [Mangrovitalea sediminis]